MSEKYKNEKYKSDKNIEDKNIEDKNIIDKNIIDARDLYFSYDDNKSYAIRGLSLRVKEGRRVAVMGANGSGKSTFFLALNGINKLSKGTLIIDGEEIKYDKKSLMKVRSKVGIVFQDPEKQLFSASVRQEISFGALNMGMSDKMTREAVEEICTKLSITPYIDKATHALSGGQKKQVSIADVLVMNPKIVILDEPFSSLDPKHADLVKEAIDILVKENVTVMISTHDPDFAYSWADEIVVIDDGKVIAHASPEEVFSNDDIMDKANIKKPTIVEFCDKLSKAGKIPENIYPRTIDEIIGILTQ